MPKTAVGLFENHDDAGSVVLEIEGLGFPRKDVQMLDEPTAFDVTGVMSFPRLDFEVNLTRELARIGAERAQAEAYVAGLRRGGVLVFATGSDEKVDSARDVMNRRGAVELEETSGAAMRMPQMARANGFAVHDGAIVTGRVMSGGGASCFVW